MTATDLSHNPMAPPLPALSPQAELALLCRTLFREGYDDHLAGHITYRQPDGTLLVNPWGLTWDEVRASDVLRIDTDGNLLEGRWTVTPAIPLHVELHRARPDDQPLQPLSGHHRFEVAASLCFGGVLSGHANRADQDTDTDPAEVMAEHLRLSALPMARLSLSGDGEQLPDEADQLVQWWGTTVQADR